MKIIKCPRCDINYIKEEEGFCKVCNRDMKGYAQEELPEMCIECGENIVMPGEDYCIFCFNQKNTVVLPKVKDELDEEEDNDEDSLGEIDDVSDDIVEESFEELNEEEFEDDEFDDEDPDDEY